MLARLPLIVVTLAASVRSAIGHGWVTQPISKNELASRLKEEFPEGGSFRYCPQCSAEGNLLGQTSSAPGSACGASEAVYEEGPTTWQKWYDSSRGLAMPTLTPGSDMELRAQITADHGGQGWMMIACGDSISDQLDWIFLQRSQADRGAHFLPNNTAVYAWAVGEVKSAGGVLTASFHVPHDFSCPTGFAVGRWLWKTANTCIDANNVGRKTETFALDEYKRIAPSGRPMCATPPEIFISCFDFQVLPSVPTAPPTPMPPTPSPAVPPILPSAPPTQPPPAPSPTMPPTLTRPAQCVAQTVLQCINEKSSYWPRCDPSQTKDVPAPDGYEFGYYCTQDWADALNEMLSHPFVNKCNDVEAVHKLLAQVAYETAYFSTVYQPQDGGAGLIHMIPGNWPRNTADMDSLFPGNEYASTASSMGKSFFQTPKYGWKSVAAWFKLTNGVIPGCGLDLFDQTYEEQTRCILSRIVDRQEAFDIVGSCMSSQPSPVPAPTPPPVMTTPTSPPTAHITTEPPTAPPTISVSTPPTATSVVPPTPSPSTPSPDPSSSTCASCSGCLWSNGVCDSHSAQHHCQNWAENVWCGTPVTHPTIPACRSCPGCLWSNGVCDLASAQYHCENWVDNLWCGEPTTHPTTPACRSCLGCMWSSGICYPDATQQYCQTWSDNLWCGRSLASKDQASLRGRR